MEKQRRMVVTYKVPIAVVKGLILDYIERKDNVAGENFR